MRICSILLFLLVVNVFWVHSQESEQTVPEWLYSYNLGIMRLGFYNIKPGILLEIGAYNNLKVMHRHHFPSYLPQNLFQFGIVNRGNGSLIRLGAVNYNPFDFWDEPGIDFGILNKGNYVQFGIAGFATNKGCQMNLVNSGEEVPQFGLINIRTGN